MRLLTAQAIADEGELEVLGFRLPGESKAGPGPVRRRAAARQPRHDADRRAEPARLHAPLPDRRAPSGSAAIERALEMAKLVDRRDSRVDKLSGGMRRRLLIARALVHRPRLVLLDEPTVGLDPQVRQELWALIDALRSEGTTILMSTHYIEEAQRLADTVLIMSHGKRGRRRAAGRARARARGPRGDRGLRLARRGSPRSRPRRTAAGLRDAAHGDEHLDPRRRRARTASRPRASAGRRTSRTSSCCSPARRSSECDPRRVAERTTRPARAPGDHGRARARGRELLLVLAVGDLLVDGRADDLPARVRLRLRLARRARSAATTTSSSSAPGSWRPRCSSRARSRRCSGRSSSTSSSAPTTRSSRRRSTPRSSSRPRRCGSRRGPASTAACR